MRVSNSYRFNLAPNYTFGAKKTKATVEQTEPKTNPEIKAEEINLTNKSLFEKLKVIFELREDDLNEKINNHCTNALKNKYPGFQIESIEKPYLELTNIIGKNAYSCVQINNGKNVAYRILIVDLKEKKLKDVFDVIDDQIYSPQQNTSKTNNERITKALVALNEYENQSKRAKIIDIIKSISNVQKELYNYIEIQEKTNSKLSKQISEIDRKNQQQFKELKEQLKRQELKIQSLNEFTDYVGFVFGKWKQAGLIRLPEYHPNIISILPGLTDPKHTVYFYPSELTDEQIDTYVLNYLRHISSISSK